MGRGTGKGQGRGKSRDDWQRERDACKAKEREIRIRSNLRETPEAAAAWQAACVKLAEALPAPTLELWVAPLCCDGESDGALVLSAPEGIRAWAARRYMKLVGDSVRVVSDYRGVFLVSAPEEDGDGCR